MEAFEREYLADLLRRHAGNISAAAREAQIDRNYIHRLVKKYNIPIEKGIPSLAVLDSKGHTLYTTGEFESARSTDPQVIVKFLDTWKPKQS